MTNLITACCILAFLAYASAACVSPESPATLIPTPMPTPAPTPTSAPTPTPAELPTAVAPTEGQTSSIVSPRHGAPLGTDNGGEYFAGRLVTSNGCLRAEAPSRDATKPSLSLLLIWPEAFNLEAESGLVRIMDGQDRVIGRTGDYVRVSRASISYQQTFEEERIVGLSEDCEEPYFLVGDEVTAFDPRNEATELRLSEPDVLFLRKETVMGFPTLPQALGLGELVLDGQCLRLDGSTTIVWPAGFKPHVHRGVVQVRNGADRVIATVGDEIAAGGGYYDLESGPCSGPVFSANQIKVLPDAEVYFPTQGETLTTAQETERFKGELALDGKCLVIYSALRVRDRALMPVDPLLIWPREFSIGLDGERVKIIDATERVVAQVGDKVEFTAFELTDQQAVEHGELDKISPACLGPYWAVDQDFNMSASQVP